jgi:hypothetical protein
MIALGVGLQSRLGTQTGAFIYTAGLVTDELSAVSAALVTISDAENGTVTQGANLVADVWNGGYRTIKTADDIINNIDGVTLEEGTRSGLLGLAYFAKAAALGELLQAFQQMPLDTYGTPTPTFSNRAAALTRVHQLLDSADAALAAAPVSSTFSTRIIARGFDLRNSINAYRARYHRIAGNNAGALAAADLVSRTVFSVLPFNDQVRNPVNTNAAGSSGVLPRDAWRLAAPAGDGRPAFHVAVAAITGRIGTPLDNYARYNLPGASIPVYYPDEMLLIKAEVLANTNQLALAQAVLDSVRTDCPGRVPDDPNACLPALTGPLSQPQLLAEIYNNRRFELFATGLRWEDTRRLDTVGAAQPGKRCWLPYPIAERNANPTNVPADPEGVDPPAAPARCF